MKKNLILTLVILTFLINTGISQKGIKFETSKWSEVLKKAEKEKKIIMVDAYTVWCGPCKWMAANTFTDKEVGEFYNKNFVCTKIDMEKGEGLEFAEKYPVQAYPTILFINSKGEKVHVGVGALEPAEFIKLGEAALNDKGNLLYYKNNYQANKTNNDFIEGYFNCMSDAYEDFTPQYKEYWDRQKTSDYSSEKNWEYINRFSRDIDSKEIQYLLKNKKEFSDKYEKDVDFFIHALFSETFNAVFNNRELTLEDFQKAKEDFKKYKYENQERLFLEADLIYYQYFEDNQEKRQEIGIELFEKYTIEDWQLLNDISWNIFLSTDKQDILQKGVKMAQRSVELNSNNFNNDTLANLLYATKNYTEALKYAKEALRLAEEAGEDLTEYKATVKKIEKEIK